MTRDTKFRAWDTIHGKMSNDFTLLACMNQTQAFVLPENFEFMQYSGLNGYDDVEMYEGDVIGVMGGDHDRPNEYEVHGIVYFDQELAAFCIEHNGAWSYLHDFRQPEVIGNIYENPELNQ